jgi:hypothetical protein
VSLATLNEANVTRMRLSVPAWGRWWADVDLAEPVALKGAAALVAAGQVMAGTIISGGAVNGRAAYRVVAGAGGWAKALPSKAYQDDGGVRLRTVLGDAAREVGETLADVPADLLGPHFARPAAPAYELLNLLAPQNWYTDFAGVTHIGRRPTTEYTGNAPRVRVDPLMPVVDLAIDSLAGLVPGVTVDGSAPAADVEFNLTPERLTASVYASATGLPGRLEAWAELLAGLDPRARYRTTYEYRVVTQDGARLNLQPVRVSSGMSDLADVPVRLAPGIEADFTLGSLVLVAFADADPSRPQVISGDASGSPGWMPMQLRIGGPGALGAARETDPVQAGPFSGVIVRGSARIKVSL